MNFNLIIFSEANGQLTILNMTEDTSIIDPNNKKVSYSTRIKYLNEIAKPLATKALTKKIYKLVKKGLYHL